MTGLIFDSEIILNEDIIPFGSGLNVDFVKNYKEPILILKMFKQIIFSTVIPYSPSKSWEENDSW